MKTTIIIETEEPVLTDEIKELRAQLGRALKINADDSICANTECAHIDSCSECPYIFGEKEEPEPEPEAETIEQVRAQRDTALAFLEDGCGGQVENNCADISCKKCPVVLATGAKKC